jgi:hypothetical protein
MARKLVCITVLLVVLVSLCGCGKAPKNNTVAPKELTKDQQEIVDILSSNNAQELLFFKYRADAEYKDMDVWVEIYKDGELIDPNAGGISMMDGLAAYSGELAIVITQNPDFQWTFIVYDDGVHATNRSEPAPHIDSLGRMFGPILDPVTIEDGKEIILYTSVFSSDDAMRTYDAQTLEEYPESLQDYDYAHIIKCKFSK